MMNIYNISAKESFVDVLAKHFLDRYDGRLEEFSRILFLLPNRRACKSLAEAFVRQRGKEATILPRISPIDDVEEDEIFLSGNSDILQKIKPSIGNMERVLTFTRMIMHKNEYGIDDVSLAQAYALAKNLASFIDTVQNEELNFADLENLVPYNYSEHWRKTLQLLKIISEYWPQILEENGKCDPMIRRKQLLQAEIDYWHNSSNRPKIVIAGTTAAYPYLREMVKTVSEFEDGEVYLYGLDKYSDDETWQSIDENHPQYELKCLLDYLGISRNSVANIGYDNIDLREKLICELMRPAATSGAWRNLSLEVLPEETFHNIHLINCDDMRQEARTIALIMRETLETEEKTTALVTMDRNLSRRVVSELKKWGIKADDSAGQPLSLTHIGIYFRLIGEAVANNTMTAKVTVMKYPFTACGMERDKFLREVYHLEKNLRSDEELSVSQQALLDDFEERIRPLKELYENPTVNLKDILETHIKVAQSLADTNIKTGEKIIWRNDDGRAAANFFVDLINKSDELGQIAANDYLPFLVTTMTEQNVRSVYGFHPRIKILGPIEARLSHYDRVIIGGVNEGVWPNLPKGDMWLSRPMKKKFGMTQAEKNIGVCAADFAHLMQAPEVFLTRAQKVDGAPTDKSRWWLRFETVLEAVFGSENEQKAKYAFLYRQPYSQWAKNIERCKNPQPIKAPCPCPKVEYRPRKLSASKIETLMRDPYSIYAQKVLHLYPLKDLDRSMEAFDFGNIVHETLEDFCRKYNSSNYPEDAKEQIMKIGMQKFTEKKVEESVIAFWKPHLQEFIDIVVKFEKGCRPRILNIYPEENGEITFKGKHGDFIITGKADRIDVMNDDSVQIIDYKTGSGRSTSEIEKVTAPQLPVEALIAEKGGYKVIGRKKVSGLQYWALKDKSGATNAEKSQNAVVKIEKVLQKLIDEFDNEKRPYLTKPIPNLTGQYDDYDHLSRILEWSVKDDNDNGD